MATLLAEAYNRDNKWEAGLHTLTQALAMVDSHGECFWAAELYRLKAELQLQHIPEAAAEAEVCLQRALAIARSQQARSLALRAAMSLSRLWQQQGHGDQAHQLLVNVYNGFSEGFDTADLTAARALLAALACCR
jgi:adenylate cyclase